MRERAPSVPQTAPKPEYETAIFSAELGDAPTIDLHQDIYQLDPENAVSDFLDKAFMQGIEVVKIIHGRGQQKLKHTIEHLLKQHSLVEYYRGSQKYGEENGVTYAVLARK